jgi:hypothetical protein
MKGLISREHGPQLTDILRLLAQADHPCEVMLRNRSGDDQASISLREGTILNATRASATGSEALVRIVSVPDWHFESFERLSDDRQDFSSDKTIVELVDSARATSAGPSTGDSKQVYTFSFENGRVTSDRASNAQIEDLTEELGFLEYYSKELGESLGLGEAKVLGVTSQKVSLALKSRDGSEYLGSATFRSYPVAQLLSQASGG